MQARTTNRFAYATLIDHGFDPADPEILLELGMENPVDWDAVDEGGAVICGRLDFVLTVDHAKVKGEPIGIHFTYARVVRDFGLHQGAHVYVLGLRPTRDKEGRECDRIALETAVGEARSVRRRSWCADVGEVRIAWRHDPDHVIALANGSFAPEPLADEPEPVATDDEVLRMCAAFDAFCDAFDDPGASCIPLDERDIEEFDLDLAATEPIAAFA